MMAQHLCRRKHVCLLTAEQSQHVVKNRDCRRVAVVMVMIRSDHLQVFRKIQIDLLFYSLRNEEMERLSSTT